MVISDCITLTKKKLLKNLRYDKLVINKNFTIKQP